MNRTYAIVLLEEDESTPVPPDGSIHCDEYAPGPNNVCAEESLVSSRAAVVLALDCPDPSTSRLVDIFNDSSMTGCDKSQALLREDRSSPLISSVTPAIQPQSHDDVNVDGVSSKKRKIGDRYEVDAIDGNMPREKCKIRVAYDAGWRKRSSGHAYNSRSGHGTAVGLFSGEVISYSVKTKDCKKCSLGHPKTGHDCRQNHTGSAKYMEAAMAVELIAKNELLERENVEAGVMVMDDDSSVTAAVRRVADGPIERWSDFNHTHK
ncbi:hypothetical protein QAD02_020600 [Eretmocerus hayati]|uniref:Uncharacterized protein n=1 Tax=Eretmocerus hayati TaxID=131215 RepID=A0ACC2PR34_9HYME|nr:hypothetical protein QAD02_020600 [Eretmocerus hayati]